MKEKNIGEEKDAYKELCNEVKKLIDKSEFEVCYKLITEEMKNSPHAPHPHNLLGMLLENKGEHLLAMKHFRAAWALDPVYLPARHNLEVFGTFFSNGTGAFDEGDCPELEQKSKNMVMHNENNIGPIDRRKRNEDE